MHQISSPRIADDDSNSVREWIDLHQPWAVIDVMRRPDIDQAERDPDRCYREVVQWPLQMASACESAGIPLLVFSSDLVFDGRRATPYSETDHTNPLGVFGRAHEQVESELLERFSKTLIVRAGEVLAPGDRRNTLARCHRALMRGGACPIQEEVLSLTYLPDLIHACLDLLLDQESGMWHLAGQGEQSWLELTRELAARTGHDPDAVRVHRRGCRRLAPRPVYRALSSIKGISLPGAMHSLDRYLHDCLHHSA